MLKLEKLKGEKFMFLMMLFLLLKFVILLVILPLNIKNLLSLLFVWLFKKLMNVCIFCFFLIMVYGYLLFLF